MNDIVTGTRDGQHEYKRDPGGHHFGILNNTVWDEEMGLLLKYTALEYDYIDCPYPVLPKKLYTDWTAMFSDRIKSVDPAK